MILMQHFEFGNIKLDSVTSEFSANFSNHTRSIEGFLMLILEILI